MAFKNEIPSESLFTTMTMTFIKADVVKFQRIENII